MAREFAKKFYKSKEWQKCRQYVFNKYYGLCGDCGKIGQEVHHKEFLTPDNITDSYISLGEDNLILLCKECHHTRHNKRVITREDLVFNEFGELIEKEL